MPIIQCDVQDVAAIQEALPCQVVEFPCKYLGLPLSPQKLPRREFLSLIDKVADRLHGWKAALIRPAGRVTLIKAVLTAIPIYHLIALQYPKWVIKAIDKIRRGFLWKGHKDIQGGSLLGGMAKVCRPLHQGGLGIHNLEMMSWSLNLRWLWLKKTQPDRPWGKLDLPVHSYAAALFDISIHSLVGNGACTLFWKDGWINGKSISKMPPNLVASVAKRAVKNRTVQEALDEGHWITDIRGELSPQAFLEYFQIWDQLQQIQLCPTTPDEHR